MNCIVWRRNPGGVTVSAAPTIAFTLLLSVSSLVYATRVAPSKRTQLASPETAGPYGEIIRGPRGRSEIALTFDGGADAECFEDFALFSSSRRLPFGVLQTTRYD
jgi:hypothetical protein